MNKWRDGALLFTFFVLFGFAGGSLFLLLVVIPIQQWVAAHNWSQAAADHFLSVFVYGWVLASAAVAYLFYRRMMRGKEHLLRVYTVLGVLVLASAGVFYLWIRHDSPFLAMWSKGEVDSGTLTFGPYPDLQKMIQLKRDGYDGVITLLSPALPFEDVLLKREEENGKLIGLNVYSFPMLPWITDNQSAIDGVKKLVGNNRRKYYIHCYLGQHRTELIHQMVIEARKQAPGIPLSLERGTLFVYKDKSIMMGPYPTDEEWVGVILREGVKEIVSVIPDLPENKPWNDKLKELAQNYKLTVTYKPLPSTPDPAAVHNVAGYVSGLDHKVFVVGIRVGNWSWMLDAALGGDGTPVRVPIARASLERGEILRASPDLYFGPYPTDEEIGMLRAAGIKQVVSLLDESNAADQPWIEKEKQWASNYGLTLKLRPVSLHNMDAETLKQISDALKNRTEPVYVHGFRTDNRVKVLYELAMQGHTQQGNPAAQQTSSAKH